MNTFKNLLIIILTLFQFNVFAQENTYYSNFPMVQELDRAMQRKDVQKLETILHANLSLGHSNGWIETKESLLKNLPTSKVKYDTFTPVGKIEIHYSHDNLRSIRRNLKVKGSYEGEDFEVDLKILEVWILEDSSWKLLSRQSVEVEFDN